MQAETMMQAPAEEAEGTIPDAGEMEIPTGEGYRR